MFLPFFLPVIFSLGLPLCSCAPARPTEPGYAGSQVIRISLPGQGGEATNLPSSLDLPIWSQTPDYLDVQVSSDQSHALVADLTSRHIAHRVLIPDLGAAISTERAKILKRREFANILTTPSEI